jgi:hypothetical protein
MVGLSDIKDGFALKHRSGKAQVGQKRRGSPRGEHTIPPLPVKHILGSFTLANPTSKRAVSDYVKTQASKEKVLHAEKVKSEHLLGNNHDCWDIHTDKDRYWVITSPTNLYSQQYFPSLDFTLSFHVGVTTRIMARSRGAPDDAQKARLPPVWRRWEQAAETLDMAEEAEDFQAVGIKCRECLIQLVRSLAKAEMVRPGEDSPQRSNFIAWSKLIANTVAGGASAERVRGHLKATAKSSWELAGWLTHARGASRHDAVFVVDATHSVVAAFGRAIIRFESGSPDQCPNCGSYNLDVGFNPDSRQPYVSECQECGWQTPDPDIP